MLNKSRMDSDMGTCWLCLFKGKGKWVGMPVWWENCWSLI